MRVCAYARVLKESLEMGFLHRVRGRGVGISQVGKNFP